MNHFKNHWDKDLQARVLESAEKIFQERYLEIYGANGAPQAAVKKGNKKLARLLAEDSTDDEMGAPSSSAMPPLNGEGSKPWVHEFKAYLDGVDEVPNGMTTTKWWGVNSSRFPV
ncbi:hypothetical protein BDZ97DRAFT_85657 [Flammula alnicola]|nr:hypothetical protein BDZ97DRAFT_85657 [Flammula alnicola]